MAQLSISIVNPKGVFSIPLDEMISSCEQLFSFIFKYFIYYFIFIIVKKAKLENAKIFIEEFNIPIEVVSKKLNLPLEELKKYLNQNNRDCS